MNIYNIQINRIAKSECVDRMAGMRVLITGATGMLGKCLVDVFMRYNQSASNPIRVVACMRNIDFARKRFAEYLDLDNLELFQMDVNEPILYEQNVDVIIHAASNTHPKQYSGDPIGTILANTVGTKNLLDYAVKNTSSRFCFLSSVEIYGENRGDVDLFDEAYLGYIDCNTLRSGYPESKRLGESLCNAYASEYGLDYCIPRLSRIYGPTMLDTDSKAIAQFIKKARAHEDIVLKSGGTQEYSYTYVTDAVEAILIILMSGDSGEAYNIADKESNMSLRDLAELLAGIGGSKVRYELPDEAEKRGYSTATKAMLDASKIEKMGWSARVHLEDGLKSAVGMSDCLYGE